MSQPMDEIIYELCERKIPKMKKLRQLMQSLNLFDHITSILDSLQYQFTFYKTLLAIREQITIKPTIFNLLRQALLLQGLYQGNEIYEQTLTKVFDTEKLTTLLNLLNKEFYRRRLARYWEKSFNEMRQNELVGAEFEKMASYPRVQERLSCLINPLKQQVLTVYKEMILVKVRESTGIKDLLKEMEKLLQNGKNYSTEFNATITYLLAYIEAQYPPLFILSAWEADVNKFYLILQQANLNLKMAIKTLWYNRGTVYDYFFKSLQEDKNQGCFDQISEYFKSQQLPLLKDRNNFIMTFKKIFQQLEYSPVLKKIVDAGMPVLGDIDKEFEMFLDASFSRPTINSTADINSFLHKKQKGKGMFGLPIVNEDDEYDDDENKEESKDVGTNKELKINVNHDDINYYDNKHEANLLDDLRSPLSPINSPPTSPTVFVRKLKNYK